MKRLFKAALRKPRWAYRQATSKNRPLPDFIIIGAQKSGTSSLQAYLSQHPRLLMSMNKAVHYFDGGLIPGIDNFEKGPAWYRAHFPIRKHAHQKVFDSTPLYLFHPLAPKRMHDLVPEAKIIALLRNPTERAISHYFHERRIQGREPLTIQEALQQEESRLEAVISEGDYKNYAFIHYSYKSRGLYKLQLERYLQYFSREQMLVLSSEEFFADPDSTLRQVFEFIGVDSRDRVKDLMPRNVARNRIEVDPDVFQYLNSYFRRHNQALYELMGKNYGW